MGFSCDGSVFTSLSLDSAEDFQLYANVHAATTYDEDTEATITAKVSGSTVVEETIKVCEYISDGNCGEAGNLTLDLSSFLPGDDVATSYLLTTMITGAYIEIKANPNGSDETCTKSTLSTAYQSASPMGSAGKAAGFAIGAVALVGLAAYAVKRRRRSMSNKNTSDYNRRLYGGDMA